METIKWLFQMLVRADASNEAVDAKLVSKIEPAYLVLGGAPEGGTHGRTFLYNEHYWILDENLPKIDIDTSRFFQTNFNNPAEMAFLASKLPKQFDVILFDFSTLKFFTGKDILGNDTLVERLKSLKAMLKDGGSLFIENLIFSGTFYSPENFQRLSQKARETSSSNNNFREKFSQLLTLEKETQKAEEIRWFLSKCDEAGFRLVARKPYIEYGDVQVVRDVFLTGDLPRMIDNPRFEILQFQKASEGGRRKQRSRKHKTRKSSRKVPQIIKHRF